LSRSELHAPGTPFWSLCRHFFPERGIIGSARARPGFGVPRKGQGIEAGKPAIGIAHGSILL